MFKKALVASVLLLTSSAFCWDPYTAPDNNDGAWLYRVNDYILAPCPNCHEPRLFPGLSFIEDRLNKLSQPERLLMSQAITDYTGDIVLGRICPFCGRPVAGDEESSYFAEEVSEEV